MVANTENIGGGNLRKGLWVTAALILLLPLIAMQFTDEVNWKVADFAILGILLAGVCATYEIVVRKTGDKAYRAGVAVALLGAFLLFWVNGAVGIIGSENNDVNMAYFALLAIGILGAFIVRFQSRGMAQVLFAMAMAQALIAVFAMIAGLGAPYSGPLEILMLNGFFIVLFIGSALLFREAARQDAETGTP